MDFIKILKMKKQNNSEVPRSYYIIENGKRLTGIVGKKVGKKYKVKWSNGTETIEDAASINHEK